MFGILYPNKEALVLYFSLRALLPIAQIQYLYSPMYLGSLSVVPKTSVLQTSLRVVSSSINAHMYPSEIAVSRTILPKPPAPTINNFFIKTKRCIIHPY